MALLTNPLEYPKVNGHRVDWSSVDIRINGEQSWIGVKEISYRDSLEPGKVRGTRSMVIGRTRGEYNAEGSITLYREEWDQLARGLSAIAGGGVQVGFMEVSFDVLVHYQTEQATITDTLKGCRITSADQSHSEGGEALVVRCDLDILSINHGGVSSISNADNVLLGIARTALSRLGL